MTVLRDLFPPHHDDDNFQVVCSTRLHQTPIHFRNHLRFTSTLSPLFTLIFVRELSRHLPPFPLNRHRYYRRQRPHLSLLIMQRTLSSPVQRQLRRDPTPHPSVNCLLSLPARHLLSFHHAQRPSLLPHPLPVLIPSHPHPRLQEKFRISRPLSCSNLSKPAKQLKKQNALRRSANRSVCYRF